MCGINAIVSLNRSNDFSQNDLRSRLQLMNCEITHRGPDSEGIHIQDPIAFGFRRLSIIDLHDAANQPMVSNDGNIVLIFNGEIYNYLEIKEELLAKGYKFRTESDTEVIINSYLEYGDECVQKFNGMWAFAIYDFNKKRLFCSRDRFGVKPFYYCIENDFLYFSSELKALHKACNLNRANLGKVYEYLAYGYRVNDGETFLENCSELLPGTNLIYENNEFQFNKYWKLKQNLYKHNDQISLQEEYTRLFESAVKLRYRSDVPVALLLSGGLDSSSIAKVTDELINRGELGQNDVQAFIASFPNFQEDETAIAREFVKTCKHIKLHEIQIDSKQLLNNFEEIIYGLDHPLATFSSIAHNNIMKECHKLGIKVVLNGQGSDEAFAGYDRYHAGAFLADQLISKKGNFLDEFKHLNTKDKYSAPFLISQIAKSVMNQNYASYLRARFQEKTISCFNKDFVKDNYPHFKPAYKFSLKGNNFNKYLLTQINQQGLNHILHYEDVSSMSQSIEIRSPFMDYRIMEFAFSIPNNLRFNKGITKVIQRDTIGKMLPDTITKAKKIGFTTPFKDYISSEPNFKTYISDVLNSKSFTSKKIWDADKIKKVFANPKDNPGFPYWRIINLEVWSKVYNITNL
jgi:asparagine synthase (glutamine-hydrolysing)